MTYDETRKRKDILQSVLDLSEKAIDDNVEAITQLTRPCLDGDRGIREAAFNLLLFSESAHLACICMRSVTDFRDSYWDDPMKSGFYESLDNQVQHIQSVYKSNELLRTIFERRGLDEIVSSYAQQSSKN